MERIQADFHCETRLDLPEKRHVSKVVPYIFLVAGAGFGGDGGRERIIFRRFMENYYVIIWNKSRVGGRDGK